MTALALFLVLLIAKSAAMSQHGIPLSAWTVVAYAWQDALVALGFGAVHSIAAGRRYAERVVMGAYWAMVLYAAINIPIGRALATPLTWPMLRAARGALADSLLLHATWANVVLMVSTVALAAWLPRVLRRLPDAVAPRVAVCALLLVVLAPPAESRIDAHGRHRNALVALVHSVLPHVQSGGGDARDWRESPFATETAEDLVQLRGAARGFNVIVVSLESTAAQYLPLYGGTGDVMPRLHALAEHALVVDRAYAAYPESIKGLFSILCSTFPAFDIEADALGRAPCRPFPEMLRQAGYETALFHSGRFDYLGMNAVIRGRGLDTLEDAGHIGGNHESSFGVDEPSTVARMLRWIDERPHDTPFFLMYMPIAGHHPYEAPSPGVFPTDADFGRYRNALRYGDESLGDLIDGVRARALDARTLWVVFGDHGEAFGQHDGNFGHTFFLYDENVRVPLVIAASALMSGQTRTSRPVSLVDVAPTVLDLLGLPQSPAHQGVSMLGGSPRMALFFTDYSLPLAGLVDGRWKAIHDLHTRRTRLFDLAEDPGETRDAAAKAPARAAWYAQTLRAWTAAQKHYVLTARDSGS